MNRQVDLINNTKQVTIALVSSICLFGAAAASATTVDEGIAVCKYELIEKRAALEVRDMTARTHEDRKYAYGTADFTGIKDVHFRCRVSNGKVLKVEYRATAHGYVDRSAWTEDLPTPVSQPNYDPNELAKPSSPPIAPSPEFQHVPD